MRIRCRHQRDVADIRGRQQRSLTAAGVRETSDSHLGQQFLTSCAKNADSIALITESGESISYRQLEKLSVRFAHYLRKQPSFWIGSHVGLCLRNSVEYVVAFYGTLIAGGVVVPVPDYPHHRIEDALESANATIVVEQFTASDSANSKWFEATPFDFRDLNQTPLSSLDPIVGSELAMLMFTTGSSGQSKAVMLSHENLWENSVSIRKILPIEAGDRALAVVPFAHALGNSVLQTHLMAGARICLTGSVLFPQQLLELIVDYQCTSITGVPEIFGSLLKTIRTRDPRLSSLRYIAVAGGRMPPDRSQKIRKLLPGTEIYLMYGQTEATARLSCLPSKFLESGGHTVGCAVPGVELEIRSDTGDKVGVRETGTLYASGANVMLGYWNDLEATAAVLTNGWLNTGDQARYTAEGWIEIVGRTCGLLKIQGYRMHVDEVERAIAKYMGDLRFAVCPFDFYGQQRLILFVEDEMQAVDVAGVRDLCRDRLPSYMVPQRIEAVDRFPHHASGKLDRGSLLKQWQQGLFKTAKNANATRAQTNVSKRGEFSELSS